MTRGAFAATSPDGSDEEGQALPHTRVTAEFTKLPTHLNLRTKKVAHVKESSESLLLHASENIDLCRNRTQRGEQSVSFQNGFGLAGDCRAVR